MAQVTGTFATNDAVGNREDLEDTIYNITPDETPFISAIGSQRVKSTTHEWQIDSLATPSSTNAQIEGDDYTYATPSATTRLKNYTQISWKTVIVSETQDAVDKAGRAKELAYQMAKRGMELRKDIEAAALANNASVAGSDNAARVAAGLPAWLTTNDERNSGADGGYNSGTGLVAAATNGTLRAFTKALMDSAIQKTYVSGGNPTTILLSPYNKRVFSSFMSDTNVAQFRTNVKSEQGTIVAAADMYVSDFGTLSVVPNRVMATSASLARNVFVLTPSMAARGVLRPITQDEPAKTGDANKRVIKTEWTLIMKNEAAHGVVADVYGLTSST